MNITEFLEELGIWNSTRVREYAVVYRTPYGAINSVSKRFPGRGAIKEWAVKNEFTVIRAVDSSRLEEKAEHVTWNAKKLREYTNYLLLAYQSLRAVGQANILKALQEANAFIRDPVSHAIAAKHERGMKLSDVLKMYPKVFDEFYISIIESGMKKSSTDTRTDGLIEALETIKNNLDENEQIKSVALKKMMMPALVGTMITMAFLGMNAGIYPRIEDIYGGSGFPVPQFTWIVHSIINACLIGFGFIVASIILAVVWIQVLSKGPKGVIIGKSIMSIPFYGSIMKKVIAYRVVQMFESFYSKDWTARIEAKTQWELIARAMRNPWTKYVFQQASLSMDKGNSYGDPIEKSRFFDEDDTNLVNALKNMANIHRAATSMKAMKKMELVARIEMVMAGITSMMFMISVMWFLVLAWAFYFPIMKASDTVKQQNLEEESRSKQAVEFAREKQMYQQLRRGDE